jgi:hypothetical protein
MSVQGAPKFYHPMFRPHHRGMMAPDYLSLCRSIGSNAIGKIGDTPKLTKWSHAGMVSGDDEKCQFYHSAPAALINYRRPLTPCAARRC